MATSLAQQINLYKSVHKGIPDPIRHPITRPSILFGPKEAADIDLRSILTISLLGLDALIEIDERFMRYKDTLFSQTTLEVDREKMVKKEEEKLDRSISSYLKLLSGYLKHPAAVKTVEYLIRRYQVHVFNVDELILCALPCHDTTDFVRIVQLLKLGNSKWGFLEGVKTSGAALPINVIVQQCIRDKGVLVTLCEYAKLTNEYQHDNSVFCFYTSIIGRCIDSIPALDTDTVRTVAPFVFDALNLDKKGNNVHKICALMLIGSLSTRATLTAKLVQNLVLYIARVAQKSADLQFIHSAIVAIVGLVQSQSVQIIPEKTMTILNDIRDFAGILSSLSQTKNIQKFLWFYIESLLDYSQGDPTFVHALISMLETLHMNAIVEKVVSKILKRCMKSVQCNDSPDLHKTGEWAKKIFVVIDKHYPTELHKAVRKFLETSKMNFKKGDHSIFKTFCLMFDEGLESLDAQINTYDSKFWFSLEHPEAKIRIAALSDIKSSGILNNISSNPQKHVNVQNAIFRRLHDDDFRVVQAALSVGLTEIADPNSLLRVYQELIVRCTQVMYKSTSTESLPCDVAVLCLEHMVMDVPLSNLDYSKEVATTLFPLLVAYPKTLKLNLKALEIANQINWPFYANAGIGCDSTVSEAKKTLDSASITSINSRTIDAMAECLVKDPERHLQWLVDCSKGSELAKSLFLLVILQVLAIYNRGTATSLKFYQACSKTLKDDWLEMEIHGEIVLVEKINKDNPDTLCKSCVDQLLSSDLRTLNIKIHICNYWCLLEACSKLGDNNEQLIILDELFLFFTTLRSKKIFKEHLQFLVKNCIPAPFQFLCKYFSEEDIGIPTEVKIASLDLLSTLCSMYGSSERTSMNENSYLQFLFGFPSIFIPLCNSDKDIRAAAVNCIEEVYKLWRQFDLSQLKNGSDTALSHCLLAPTFGEFLQAIVSQKLLISSDANFLSSFLMSMLKKSSTSLLLHENVNKRFDQASKDSILHFIVVSALKFSLYGKLVVLSAFKGWGSTILDVEGVRKLFYDLLDQRTKCHLSLDKSAQKLSAIEIDILCLLLEVCVHASNSTRIDRDISGNLLEALKVESLSADEPAVVKPCIAVLQNLTCSFYNMLEHDMQDEMFGELVSLFRNDNVDIRSAVTEAVMRINLNSSTITRCVKLVLGSDQQNHHLKRLKREKGLVLHKRKPNEDLHHRKTPTLQFLGSLLDIILLKKNMEKREDLVRPLFQVLEKLFSKEWLVSLVKQEDQESSLDFDFPESVISDINHAQQTTLLILQDITDSLLLKSSPMKELSKTYKIHLLVQCARTAEDVSTRNRILLLLSSIAKAAPEWLSEQMFDIITIIGESALKQIDSHSQSIMEELISTLVPCWLSLTKSISDLLQIFIRALPEVPEHRRLTLIVYLLRSMGEKENLGILIYHLFVSLITHTQTSSPNGSYSHDLHPFSDLLSGWEYTFSIQLTCQYPCEIWLPCLLQLLKEIKLHSDQEESLPMLYMTLQFILHMFEEMYYELDSTKDPEFLQDMFGLLLEQIVMQMQLVNVKSKQDSLSRNTLKNIKDCSIMVLKTITAQMLPSCYFRSITRLLGNDDANVKKKALVLLCKTLKDQGEHQKMYKGKRKGKHNFVAKFNLDEKAVPSFDELCYQIIQLISCTASETPVKLTAVSSIEILAKEIPGVDSTFTTCLGCVVRHITSADLLISAACLRSTSSLVHVLGSKSLPHLPHIMKHMLERVHELSKCPIENPKYSHINTSSGSSNHKEAILLSIVTALESVIENLGGFLNPYLNDILDVVVLHQEYISDSDAKLKQKAETVRKLLAEKIPVRVLLNPMLKLYSSALQSGESSLCLVFEMLASIVGVMDKALIGTYHAKIFNHCLVALDIRRQSPILVKNVNMVEQSVIHAVVMLTMKLTETMFRPLFILSLEWVDSKFEENESTSVDRTITYYNLINKLAEKHRSLFVPYFKYLLDGCTKSLTEDADIASNPVTHKKKKAKREEDPHSVVKKTKGLLSPKQWHLRALILKSLHQCFLYDTSEHKFLDAPNFQILLKPIVAQIAVEPPKSSGNMTTGIPSVEEFDEILVSCLGQMAVTARSDVLWKPLNHEVLMQTRSETVRPKILGLKVIKYLIEHLKEEYLVFLAETIPFLGELLEDVDLSVKTLAQEILKEMEILSGENLQQYL